MRLRTNRSSISLGPWPRLSHIKARSSHFTTPRGEPSSHLPPEAIIFFAQNHDQVGNRAFGERLAKLVSPEKLRQALALVLLNPHIPMLFMGEEAAIDTPFLFFADWEVEAAELTREGRRKEFAHFKAFSTPEMRAKIPDLCAEQTFQASKLDWTRIDRSLLSLEFRGHLLQIRRDKIVPLIKSGFVSAERTLLGKSNRTGGLDVRWRTKSDATLQIVANFGDIELPMPELVEGESLWQLHPADTVTLLPNDIIVRLGGGC